MTAVVRDPLRAETLITCMHSDHQSSVDIWLFSGDSTKALFQYGIVLCFLYRLKVSVTKMALGFAPCAVFWLAIGIGLFGGERRDLQYDQIPSVYSDCFKTMCSQGCSSSYKGFLRCVSSPNKEKIPWGCQIFLHLSIKYKFYPCGN